MKKIDMFHSDNTTGFWLVALNNHVGSFSSEEEALNFAKSINLIEESCFGAMEIYKPYQKHEYAGFVPMSEITKPYQITEKDFIDIVKYKNDCEVEAEKRYQEYLKNHKFSDDSAFDFLFN
jgi:hypothetical protein